jgi:hypothetical protein
MSPSDVYEKGEPKLPRHNPAEAGYIAARMSLYVLMPTTTVR